VGVSAGNRRHYTERPNADSDLATEITEGEEDTEGGEGLKAETWRLNE
jgi:hypothetical protein